MRAYLIITLFVQLCIFKIIPVIVHTLITVKKILIAQLLTMIL